jgi:rubrerythrin
MGNLFYASEIARMNITEEHNGALFYDALAKSARTDALREFAKQTADMERKHEKIFTEMAETLEPHYQAEQYEGEYDDYVAALLKGKIFPDGESAEKMALEAETDLAAVDIAIAMEKNTLLLLTELQRHVRAKEQDAVELMMEEEKAHLVSLSKIREQLPE